MKTPRMLLCRTLRKRQQLIRKIAVLFIGGAVLTQLSGSSFAANLYWDGTTSTANADGGGGVWNTANTFWDTLPFAGTDTNWVNGTNTAVLGGTAGNVSLGANIDVGGLQFDTTGYNITTTGFSLNFAATNNTILFNNIAAATITGPVGGSGNVLLKASNPATAGTLTFNGTSAGGWSGTTSIGAGMTLSLAGSNQALKDTMGITLNGGGITLTNTNSTEGALDRISNSAGISSNGGTITYTNTSGTTQTYAETIGSVDLVRGQLNFVETISMGAGNIQTLTLSGLSHTTGGNSNTSAVSFGSASGLNITTNIIKVTGASGPGTSGSTSSVAIIGPWASYGTTPASPTDYAVYDASGRVLNASISATTENSAFWVSGNNVTLGGATALTGTRTLNTLRYTGAAGTLDLGSNLNLQTYGILNGGAGLTISTTGTGAVTTPSGGGSLYLTSGAAAITVSAPINDNGGAVTVVKSGSAGLTLSSTTSNFSGGIVLNAGSLTFTNNLNLGNGGGITVNGTASIDGGDQYSLPRTLTLNDGALLTLNNGFGVTGVFSGNGALNVTSPDDFNFTNAANTYTGTITSASAGSTSYGLTFASIGDTAGAGLINLVGGSGTFRWTSASGSTTTLANRQFAITGTGSGMISALGANAASNLVINKDLLITGAGGARTLLLNGTNTGLNTFAGRITDGIDGGASVVSVTKDGAGTWVLGGTNTFTGATTISAGTLRLANTGAVASSSGIVMNTASNSLVFGTDTAFTTLPLITGSSGAFTYTLVSDRATAGTGITHGLGQINFGSATFNFTSGSNVTSGTAGITFASAIMTSGTTGTSILNPTTATLTITGGVSSQTNNVARTLQLDGTGTGHSIGGVITQTVASALSVSKTNSSTWTLGGANTYTGTTTISGGKLLLSNTGSLHASSAVTVSGGAIGGTGTVNGSVSLTTAGGIDLRDSSVGTFALGSTLANSGAAGANNLYFDLGNGTNTTDKITVAGTTTLSATAGSVVIHLNQLGGLSGTGPDPGSSPYTLIQSTGALTNGTSAVLNTTKAFHQTYSLGVAGNNLNLTTAAGTAGDAVNNHFWKGSTSVWNTAAWFSDSGATTSTSTPGYDSNVVFAATTPANLTNTLGADFEINSLMVNSGVAATNISGNMLTIDATNANSNTAGNGVTVNNVAGTTIASKVGLAASQTWTVGTGAALTVSGTITDFAGGYTLTKSGAGVLLLNTATASSYSGGTIINGGRINITTDGALGDPNGSITLNGGTLGARSDTGTTASGSGVNITSARDVIVGSSGGSISVSGNNNFTTTGKLTGTGTLTKVAVAGSGGQTLNFNGTNNDFTGAIVIDSSNTAGGTISFASIGDTSGVGNLISGSGTTATTNIFQYSGSTDLTLTNRGIETQGSSMTLATTGKGSLTIIKNLVATGSASRTLTLDAAAGTTNVFAGSIGNPSGGGTVGITKTSPGAWVFTNTNGYTGATTISAGTLQLGNGGTTGALTGTTGGITNNGNLTINRNNAFTQATDLNGQIISGTGSLTQSGTGDVTLSLANTFTGATTVTQNAGSLTLTNNQALQNSALTFSFPSQLVLSGTTTPTIGGINSSANLASVSGYSNVTDLTLNPQTGITATYSGNLSNGSGAMNLVKSGAGTQVLSGVVSYTGTTTVSAGTLQINQGNLSGGTITLGADGATLTFLNGGGSAGISGLGGSTISNAIVLGNSVTTTGAKLYATTNAGKWNFTGNITGAPAAPSTSQTLLLDTRAGGTTGGDRNTTTLSGVIADGNKPLNLNFAISVQTAASATNNHPAYVNLTGLNTFTGSLTATRANVGATSWLTIGGERWSDGSTNTPTYGRMGSGRLGDNTSGVYSGPINFGSTAGNIVNLDYFSSANQTWSGVIGGGANNIGALVKEGSGTLTLTNANGYTRTTTIGGGTLTLGFNSTTTNILPTTTPLNMGLGTSYYSDSAVGNAVMTISGGGGGGTLQLGGAATGVSTQTVASLTTATNTANRILLGANRTLTITSPTITIGANSGLNFNTAAGGADAGNVVIGTSIVVFGTGTVTSLTNGFTVTDSTGFGLAKIDSSNQVIRDITTALLPVAGATSATNYRIDNNGGGSGAPGSSSLAVTTSQSASSLTVDTGSTNGVLTLNSGVVLSNNVWNFGAASGTNTYQITGNASGAGIKPVATGNTIVINNYNPGAVTFNSPILAFDATANALVVGGIGTVSLAGVNTFTGATTINSGNLQIGGAGSLQSGSYAGAININGGSVLQYSSSAAQILSGVISGPGGITKDTSSTSTLTLTSSNTNVYTGPTTISLGRLTTDRAASGPQGGLSAGSAVTIGSGGQLNISNNVTTISNNITISGIGIADTVGSTSANSGAIRVVSGNGLSGQITLAADARLGFNTAGNGVSAAYTGKITGPFALEFFGMYGTTNGANAIHVLGNPSTTNINDYTGNTSISTAATGITGAKTTLRLGASEQLPNGTGKGNLVFTGADADHLTVFELNGFSETINGLSNTAATGAVIQNTGAGASTLTIGDANSTSSFSGLITDGGAGKTLALTKIGAGTLTLSGTNSFTGTVAITGGTLSQAAPTNLGTGTNAIAISNNAVLQITATNSFSRGIALGTGGGTLDVTGSAVATRSGSITGSSGLTKIGTGTLTLTGTNTYSGATTVSAGKMSIGTTATPTGSINSSSGVAINGATANLNYNSTTALSAPVTFTQGTLSGTNWNGSLSGLTIDTGKTIAPGNSPGTAASVIQTWAGGGTYQWEINNATGAKGGDPGWDWLNLSGVLTQTATSASKFTIDITGLNLTNTAGAVSNWNPGISSSFVIASAAGGINGFDPTGFTLNTANFTNNNTSTGTWSIFQGNGTNGGTANDILLGYIITGSGNNSQLLITSSPTTSFPATGVSTKAIGLSSIFVGGNSTTGTETITKSGSDGTTYSVTTSGAVASTTFVNGSTTASGTITLVNTSSGAKSGTVTIDNLASDSFGAGLGSADGDDVFTVTQNVFQTASITGAATGGNLNLTNAASTDGGQRAGITVSGFALSNAATDNRRASNFNAPALANGGVVGNATASDVTATVGTYSLKADRLNNATVSYRATATATGGVYTDTALAALATPTIPTLPIIANQTGAVSTVARDGVMGNYGSARLADIANGDTLAGYSSTVAAAAASGTDRKALGTTATILAGTATSDMTVSMAWRVRGANESSSLPANNDDGTAWPGYLISDVVNLSGMGAGATDTFVLQMSYSEALLGVDVTSSAKHENDGANNGRIALVWNNAGVWENAVLGNFGGTSSYYKRAYNSDPLNPDNLNLGRWGVDTTTNTVWAVLNHNSEFAVIPEPSTLVLGGLALLGLAGAGLRKRRLAK